MEAGRRRGTSKNVVVAGSVSESRMKSDEVKGGIKVLNADEKPDENGEKKLRPKQSPIGVNGKRKTWKSESSDGGDRNPTQISRQRSEPTKELRNSADGINVKSPIQKIKKTRSEVGRELSVSVDGIEKSSIRKMRTRSEVGRELSMSVDGIERSPIQKSQSQKSIRQSDTESSNGDEIERNPIQKMRTRSEEIIELSLSVPGNERNPVQIRTTKSEFLKLIGQSGVESVNGEGIERNSKQLRKVKSESNKGVGGESGNVDGIEGNSVQLRKVKSESKNGLGESVDANEKSLIPSTQAKSVPSKVLDDGIERKPVELEAKSEPNEAIDESVEEIDKNPVGIEEVGSNEFCKEFGVCEEKVISTSLSNLGQVKSAPEMVLDDEEEEDYVDDEEEDWDEEFDEEVDEEIEIDEVKEIDIKKPKQIVIEEKKVQKIQEKLLPVSPIVKKQVPPLVNHSRIHPIPTKTTSIPVPNGVQRPPETQTRSQRVPETHNKLQSLVDLVMWRDVSKSAFVFGLGTFIIISFSYTKDLNISFITVVSYLGLIYLAAIFLFRSIICRGVINEDDTRQGYLVGEEDATWLLKMVLPYLNEFLLKLRALFSGDPATTMKLAVLLFVLARSGSSITIWKMAKLGFFGVFTLPKICSSYSSQLTNYGKFWVRRFKDAWESCSHKKAVAFGIFTLVWNLSSVVARVWAVFMLYVAFRYYQQSMVTDNWVEEEPKCETTWQDPIGEHRRGRRTATVDARKNKKKF